MKRVLPSEVHSELIIGNVSAPSAVIVASHIWPIRGRVLFTLLLVLWPIGLRMLPVFLPAGVHLILLPLLLPFCIFLFFLLCFLIFLGLCFFLVLHSVVVFRLLLFLRLRFAGVRDLGFIVLALLSIARRGRDQAQK